MPVHIKFLYAARSVVGHVRQTNQDSGYAGPNLLVLADGMGGPAGGDIASSSTIEHLRVLDGRDYPVDEMLPLLNSAVVSTHRELTARSTENPRLSGLGTTCIAILRSHNTLAMVHIGDSRAYLLRNGVLYQETTDHSLVQFLVDTGQITSEEAEHHPQRHVVIRILGDSQTDVSLDESIHEAQVGDRLLLCSDGLSGVVSFETIRAILNNVHSPAECAEELIDLALRAGGPDNITCVIADVVPESESQQSVPEIVGAAANKHLAVTEPPPDVNTNEAPEEPEAHHRQELQPFSELQSAPPNDSQRPRKTRAKWGKWGIAIALCITAIVCSYGAYLWTQNQYYVIGEGNSVVIYQGIPQTIGSIPLSHRVEVTPVRLSSLSEDYRQRLREPVVRSSREDAETYVGQLRMGKQNPAIILTPDSAKNDSQQSHIPQSQPQHMIPSDRPDKAQQ